MTRSSTGVVPTAQGKVPDDRTRAADRELSLTVEQIRQRVERADGDFKGRGRPQPVSPGLSQGEFAPEALMPISMVIVV